LDRCYRAASKVVRVVLEDLAHQKYMRYVPESHYIFATFASAFLLKLLRPKFSPYLDVHQHSEVLDLVEKLIEKLNDIAMDDRHAPKLYSRFLNGLLKKGKKILNKGSQASTSNASSPNDPSSVSNQDPTSPGNEAPSPSYAQYPGDGSGAGGVDPAFLAGQQQSTQQQPAAQPMQGQYQQQQQQQQQQPGAATFNMEGVQGALPEHVWPYGVGNAGPADPDQLMSMQMFGEQFWEDALLPGFAWSSNTPAHMTETNVPNPALLEQEMQMQMTMQNQFMDPTLNGMNVGQNSNPGAVHMNGNGHLNGHSMVPNGMF